MIDLYELIKYMDPTENKLTYELDNKITNLFKELEKKMDSKNIQELIRIINERKVIISNNK